MPKKYSNADLGLLLVRLALAAVFIMTGWHKIQNFPMTIKFFGVLGLHPLFAYVVTAVEFLGGLAMLLGIGTYTAGLLLAVDMLGAMYFVTWAKAGLQSSQLEFTLFASALAIAFIGAGRYTADKWVKK